VRARGELPYNGSPRGLSIARAFHILLPMTIAAKSFVAAVNHLLIRESWARERLARYAGKTARLASPPFVVSLTVQADGLLAPFEALPTADGPPEPELRCDVSISVPAAALPVFAQGGQAAVMKYVTIEGDAEFAATLAKLAEHLRWEPEEDLARLVGDGPAYRLAGLARAVTGQFSRTGRNLLESVAEYLLDENPQLVRRTALDSFSADLAHTRDALARLEKRLERLEQGAGRPPPPGAVLPLPRRAR
jgi:ubiquinone biosynthesis protein UbiJ